MQITANPLLHTNNVRTLLHLLYTTRNKFCKVTEVYALYAPNSNQQYFANYS